MAVDRQGFLPKQIYLDLGVDAGTWSRWTSYEDERTIPTALLLAVLRLMDPRATEDFILALRERTSP